MSEQQRQGSSRTVYYGSTAIVVLAIGVFAVTTRRFVPREDSPNTAQVDPILATVNGEQIRESDIQIFTDMLSGATTAVATEEALDLASARSVALHQAITSTILYQEAARRGISVDDGSVEEAWYQRKGESDLNAAMSDEAEFVRQHYGISWEEWEAAERRGVESGLKLEQLSEQFAAGAPTPTPLEVTQFVATIGLKQNHVTLQTLTFTETNVADDLYEHLENDLVTLEQKDFGIHMLDHGWNVGAITEGLRSTIDFSYNDVAELPEYAQQGSPFTKGDLHIFHDIAGTAVVYYIVDARDMSAEDLLSMARDDLYEQRKAEAISSEIERLISEAQIEILGP